MSKRSPSSVRTGNLVGIGRVPRCLAIGFLFLSGMLCALLAEDYRWVWILLTIPLVTAIVSFRVRADVLEDRLVIRSYWRTYSFDLAELALVSISEYGGFWSMGQPADIVGIVQVDIYEKKRTRETVVPAMVCVLPRGRRVVEELNKIINEAQNVA